MERELGPDLVLLADGVVTRSAADWDRIFKMFAAHGSSTEGPPTPRRRFPPSYAGRRRWRTSNRCERPLRLSSSRLLV